jgi:hypothetical protein
VAHARPPTKHLYSTSAAIEKPYDIFDKDEGLIRIEKDEEITRAG